MGLRATARRATQNEERSSERVVIVSGDRNRPGGVSNFVATLMDNLSGSRNYVHFTRGALLNRDVFVFKILNAVLDNFLLAKMCLVDRPDCLHVNPSLNPKALFRDGLFILMARLLGIKKIIVFFHGWDVATEQSLRSSAFARRVFRMAYGKSSLFLVLASQFKASLVDLGLDPERIEVTTTMFEGELLQEALPAVRKRGIGILFLSRFVEEKGVHELVEAFASIAPRYPEARLVLAGVGPARESARARVEELGLQARVSLPGQLAGRDKALALAEAEIFVLPTRHGEGCPVALLEAMAAGEAVVTTAVGGIPDIFEDGRNGILIETVSRESVADAIEQLLQNEALRRRIGECNRRYAWKNFEAKVVTGKLESFYDAVLAGAWPPNTA